MPERDAAAIFALPSGQQRVNELFRRAQRMRVSRTVVATVAMQDDYMKRVRGGGGARDQLRAEGIVIFGDYAGDQVLASALGLPRPGPGEFVSARLARRQGRPRDPGSPGGGSPGGSPGGGSPGDGSGGGSSDGGSPGVGSSGGSFGGDGCSGGRGGDYARSIRLAGADWLLACGADPASPAPVLPR